MLTVRSEPVKAEDLKPCDLFTLDPGEDVPVDFDLPDDCLACGYFHTRTDQPLTDACRNLNVWRISSIEETTRTLPALFTFPCHT
ncbi:MAG TPA: hypothetical protein VF538_17450 [Pyrinomonadaceae bacterium]|jgi:hypothetical protein